MDPHPDMALDGKDQHMVDARPLDPIPTFAFQHKSIYDLARAFEYAFEAVDAVQEAGKAVTDAKDIIRTIPDQIVCLLQESEKRIADALWDFSDEKKCGSGAYTMHWQSLQHMTALNKAMNRIFEKADKHLQATGTAELKKLQRERREIERIYEGQKAATVAAARCLADIINAQAENRHLAELAERKLQKLRDAKEAGFWAHLMGYWRL